jgi:hypothetical protein
MRKSMKYLVSVAIAALAAGFAGPLAAAENGAVNKDLTSVIALLGLPCGQVASAQQRGDNDYIATCTDGNRYRVYTNAQGRVVAEKQ